jgi:hypothetical protein
VEHDIDVANMKYRKSLAKSKRKRQTAVRIITITKMNRKIIRRGKTTAPTTTARTTTATTTTRNYLSACVELVLKEKKR